MNTIREIQRNGALRQVNDVAARRKHKDFVGEYIEFQRVDKFLRIARILPFEQFAQPTDFFIKILLLRRFFRTFFIAPMRRHTVLGDLVHLLRTDLNFDRLPRFADDRRM